MSRLVDAARVYAVAGVRFRHRGRNPARGLDCAGLVVRAYADCGVTLPDFIHYGREPYREGLQERVAQAMGPAVKLSPVSFSDLEHGDVVLLRFFTEPHHVAIIATAEYAGTQTMNIIHADGLAGRVVEVRLTQEMVSRITHVHRKTL